MVTMAAGLVSAKLQLFLGVLAGSTARIGLLQIRAAAVPVVTYREIA
jgi:hypothetical protein